MCWFRIGYEPVDLKRSQNWTEHNKSSIMTLYCDVTNKLNKVTMVIVNIAWGVVITSPSQHTSYYDVITTRKKKGGRGSLWWRHQQWIDRNDFLRRYRCRMTSSRRDMWLNHVNMADKWRIKGSVTFAIDIIPDLLYMYIASSTCSTDAVCSLSGYNTELILPPCDPGTTGYPLYRPPIVQLMLVGLIRMLMAT